MEMQDDRSQVAVYIDFDNIVMSRYDELHGRQAFRDDNASKRDPQAFIRQRLLEARVEIAVILEFASSFGAVAVSRAYADWSNVVNASYSEDLLRSSIDLVQMFPVTGSKNGADIRLAIDVIDDVARFPHLTHVVIVAGDSDYMSLAQRCRRLGRHVIGIGAAKSVGRFFKASCDEFRFYGNLPGVRDLRVEAPTAVDPQARVAEPAELLIRAAQLLAAKAADEWLAIGGLKGQMLRLDPTFDENGMGYRSFTDFLRRHANLVETRWPDGVPGGQVRLKDPYSAALESMPEPVNADDKGNAVVTYAGSGEVGEIWKGLGLLTGPGGPQWEQECVAAVRSAWRILANNPDAIMTRPPTTEVLLELGGERPTVEQRRAVHTIFGLLPWLGRDEESALRPNPDFSSLSEDDLLELLRQSIASRAQHKLYPKRVTTADVASAIFGSAEASENAVTAFERALALPTVQQMTETLSPQLLPAPVLWDVASAMVAISAQHEVATVDALAEALGDPLKELERDPSTVPMQKAYMAMTESGVLASPIDTAGVSFNQFEDAATEAVAAQVIRQWASKLEAAGQAYPHEPMWLESFYRLVLPDRSRIAWRGWVRELL